MFNGLSTENKEKKNETVVVDYIGANAGKPLHIGHICTPSVGQTIINIHEYLGYDVIGDSHFGDWGGIFGKLILIYKYRDFLKKELDSEEISIYEKIHDEIARLYRVETPMDENTQKALEELDKLDQVSRKR